MKPHAIVFALMTFVLAGCAVAGHAVRERAIAQTCREPGPMILPPRASAFVTMGSEMSRFGPTPRRARLLPATAILRS